jgi:hypothetical protein
LAARWSGYSNGQDAEFNKALKNTIAELATYGCNIVILREVPNFGFEPPKALALARMQGKELDSFSVTLQDYEERFAPHSQNLSLLTIENINLEVINPGIIFSDPEGLIFPFDDGGVLYRDSHHLSTHGSMKLKEQFLKKLSK